jgi:undecaprenyl-diphosphatase
LIKSQENTMQQKHKQEDQKDQQIEKDTSNQESLGKRIEDDVEAAGEGIEDDVEAVVKEARQDVAAARRPWYQSIRWGYVLLTFNAILLALFALLAWWVYYHSVLNIDVTITREFQENQNPWIRDTMIAVSYIGNVAPLSLGLIVLAAVLFWIVDLRLEAVTVVVVSATSALLNGLIKAFVARSRPSASLVEIIQAAGGKSFPSGHVMAYVAFWGLLFSFGVILFKGNRWWRVALLIIPALFVVLVGPSRIYLGDHWASDVLGAYIFGGVWLSICLWAYLKLKEKCVLTSKRKRTGLFHKYVK